MGRSALEFRLQYKHLRGMAASVTALRRDGVSLLFNDLATYMRVETALFQKGRLTEITYQGQRQWARFGMWFDDSIGYRVDAPGQRTPLNYGEIKLDLNTKLVPYCS